jgi:hypothetical protein
VKRKIAMLVRMDASHHWCQMRWGRPNSRRDAKARRILVGMQALGRTMTGAIKTRAIDAINEQRGRTGRPALT